MMDTRDPWRAFVTVAQIPDTGLHLDFEADQATREAMAEIADLREIQSASASFDLSLKSRGRVRVSGHARARIGQTCVVTLDPIENDIDEPIDLIFAPAEQTSQLSDLVDKAVESDEENPEALINGVIDLGRLATDVLFLAVNPYPRKPDAAFEPLVEAADPEDHPFAALKALQSDSKSLGLEKHSTPNAKAPKGGKRG
jgi:hypothetical protein